MLWSEVYELEDCDVCPLLSEGICSRGMSSSPSGTPIEPPCLSFSPDTDLDKWISDYYDYVRRVCDERAQAFQEKENRERKNKIRAARRRYSENYCVKERLELKRLKSRLQSIEGSVHFASSLHEASRFADSAMNGSSKVEKYKVPEHVQNEIERLQSKIKDAEVKLKANQKECRDTEFYSQIADMY